MSRSQIMLQISMMHYDSLRSKITQLEVELGEARKQRDAMFNADSEGRVTRLTDALARALHIVQYAVGNLDPATVAGWPYEDLAALARLLPGLPLTEDIQGLMVVFDEFAKTAEGFEAYRRERDKHRIVVPASPDDFGPKTEEAAAIHATRTPDENEKEKPSDA